MPAEMIAPSCPKCQAACERDDSGFWKCGECHWRSFAERSSPVAGVRCPNAECRSPFHRTVRTVPKVNNMIWRYRICQHCGTRFRTEERISVG